MLFRIVFIRIFIFLLFLHTATVRAQSCLNFSTYFGKIAHDEIKGICTDPLNNVYVIGNTYSTDLPVTSGAFQNAAKGDYEAFLAKFDSCGSLVWCTYFGTSGFDSGEKITYSSDNSIVICGFTDGSDLATTSGCFQSAYNGGNDCFMAKFLLTGVPVWITYFGAAGGDFAYDVKTDALGNIALGGTSISSVLYTSASSFQQNLAGATDAFIARFNKQGVLKFSTFYGGTGSEDIHALAIDKDGSIIGVGGSFSTNLNTSPSCFQSSTNGGMEVYVIKLDSTGQRVFSTYVGSSGTDDAFGVCADSQKNIYVSGHTNSGSFFTSAGAFQQTNAGGNDSYCLKMDANGVMQWSTLLGGSSNEFTARMCINSLDEINILLSSESTDFPMMGVGNNTVLAGNADAVVIKLHKSGVPFWSGYIGGSIYEKPHDITPSTHLKKIAIAGSTNSSNYPLSGNSYQNSFAGTEDGFITWQTTQNTSIGIDNENACDFKIHYDESSEALRLDNNTCYADFDYQVYSVSGQTIRSGRMADNSIIVSDLHTGVYFISMQIPGAYPKEMKFIKK